MSRSARTCPNGHGRMDQWSAHDHQPTTGAIEKRHCHAVWKCLRCFHQISRPFDCVIGVLPGATVLMSETDAGTYPDGRVFGVPIEVCPEVTEGHVWIRQPLGVDVDDAA